MNPTLMPGFPHGTGDSPSPKGGMWRFGRRIRNAVIWIALLFGLGFSLAWWFRVTVFGWLIAPADGMLSPHEGLPIYTGPTEILGVTISLAWKSGVVTATPAILILAYRLVSPLLKPHERRYLTLFMPASVLCFLAGASFAYFLLLPAAMGFFLSFGEGFAIPMIRISEYLSIAISMIWWIGLIFELPLAMFMLAKLGVISHGGFGKIRKYVGPTAGIFGALLSPGMDMVTALLIGIPIWVLFEAGLMAAWLASPENGDLMLRRIKSLAVGILRRVAVLLLTPALVVLAVLYAVASGIVDVVDGDLSTGTPSRTKAWVDGAHARMRDVLAEWARLR